MELDPGCSWNIAHFSHDLEASGTPAISIPPSLPPSLHFTLSLAIINANGCQRQAACAVRSRVGMHGCGAKRRDAHTLILTPLYCMPGMIMAGPPSNEEKTFDCPRRSLPAYLVNVQGWWWHGTFPSSLAWAFALQTSIARILGVTGAHCPCHIMTERQSAEESAFVMPIRGPAKH